MFPGSGDQKDLGRYLALSQVGLEMAAPIGLGWLLELVLGWSPWGVVAGAAIGFVGGVTHLVRMTNPKKPGPDAIERPRPSDDAGSGGPP